MSYGSEFLLQQIEEDLTVRSLISTYNGGADRMIFVGSLLPETIVQNSSVTINIYLLSPIDHRLEYGDFRYTVNCRGPQYSDALSLAKAVVEAVNRLSREEYFFTAVSQPVIPPADGTDNYNAPVEVGVKTRRF